MRKINVKMQLNPIKFLAVLKEGYQSHFREEEKTRYHRKLKAIDIWAVIFMV